MLRDQHPPGFAAQRIHAADIGYHIAFEQVEQAANGVQQHQVVAGFGNCQVKARVGGAFLGA